MYVKGGWRSNKHVVCRNNDTLVIRIVYIFPALNVTCMLPISAEPPPSFHIRARNIIVVMASFTRMVFSAKTKKKKWGDIVYNNDIKLIPPFFPGRVCGAA